MRTLDTAGGAPGPLQIWLAAARPKTLWAAFAPVLIGTAMAWRDGVWHGWSALAALLGALSIQIATNFCNDYADHVKGADTSARLGPVRPTAVGWVSPGTMLRATVLAFLVAGLFAAYLVVRGGWPVACIAVLALLFGVLYSVGPYALAYRGGSELMVFIFFGPVATGGTYYVQAQAWSGLALAAGCAPGLLACGLLTINNLRDIEQDRAADKRTLAVKYSPGFARATYVGCVGLALLGTPWLFLWREDGAVWAFLIPLLAVLMAVTPVRAVLRKTEGTALNVVLHRTGKLLLLQAVLFSIGWVLR